MDMTLNEYIQNPMGVKNAVFTQREMYRALYTDKLNKILLRELGKVQYYLYKNGDKYLIHIKVPSEVIEKFYYDTVLEFYSNTDIAKASSDLKSYNVKFYSNDSAFVFTFAHAFLKNDLFIRDLVPRMSKKAVMDVAKEKNPKNVVGYVKSIYFAFLIITNYGLMKKVQFDNYAKPYDLKKILASIEHADIRVAKRQEAQAALTKKKSSQTVKAKVSNVINKATKSVTKTKIVKTSAKHVVASTKKSNTIKRK